MSQITSNTAGIAITTFIIAVIVSMTYYQFIYISEANRRPVLPKEILNPPEVTNVRILQDSFLQSNSKNFEPKSVRGIIGISNKVVWTNEDTFAHTVTSDEPAYVDQINGKFDSLAHGGVVGPGETFEFTFTKVGEYHYHCEPHPWMEGTVDIVENFS